MVRMALALVVCGAATARAAPCLPYEPSTVTLTGVVQRVKAYGPPGFGETPRQDAKEDFDGLRVDTPVCTIANPAKGDPAEASIPVLQMIFLARHAPLPAGRRVTVTGKLSHADNGHHHTLVMIEVASVQ